MKLDKKSIFIISILMFSHTYPSTQSTADKNIRDFTTLNYGSALRTFCTAQENAKHNLCDELLLMLFCAERANRYGINQTTLGEKYVCNVTAENPYGVISTSSKHAFIKTALTIEDFKNLPPAKKARFIDDFLSTPLLYTREK